jgi:polar amino acid transport system permease protein
MSPLETQLRIVLPQAFFNMLPALTGRYVVSVKNTSLAFLIGLADLTEIGKQIGARLMTAPIEVYITLLMIYFIVNRGLSLLMRLLEDRSRFNRIFLRI